MPTLAPARGCPSAEVTRPEKVTFCAALPVAPIRSIAAGRTSNFVSHDLCMTDLAVRGWIGHSIGHGGLLCAATTSAHGELAALGQREEVGRPTLVARETHVRLNANMP